MATMGFTNAHPLLSAFGYGYRWSPPAWPADWSLRTARRRIAASQLLRMAPLPGRMARQ